MVINLGTKRVSTISVAEMASARPNVVLFDTGASLVLRQRIVWWTNYRSDGKCSRRQRNNTNSRYTRHAINTHAASPTSLCCSTSCLKPKQ